MMDNHACVPNIICVLNKFQEIFLSNFSAQKHNYAAEDWTFVVTFTGAAP